MIKHSEIIFFLDPIVVRNFQLDLILTSSCAKLTDSQKARKQNLAIFPPSAKISSHSLNYKIDRFLFVQSPRDIIRFKMVSDTFVLHFENAFKCLSQIK